MRITLGGGGTDDPRYVAKHGGFAITAAIDRYVYVSLTQTFGDGYTLRYSDVERVATPSAIQHPILRAGLEYFKTPPGVEIVSIADLPSGTGLGSSGAFTVALCMALANSGCGYGQTLAAEDAAYIELDVLKRPGGKQDHHACARGGARWLKFAKTGYVYAGSIDAPDDVIASLEGSLRLYYTGVQRDANHVLSTQTTEGLDGIKQIGYRVHHHIVSGDIDGLGRLMNDHWQLKRKRSSEMSNFTIDQAYDTALNNGAIGGKLVGAGGGGFLLFVTEDAERLTGAMAGLGMPEIPFRFDNVGATLINV